MDYFTKIIIVDNHLLFREEIKLMIKTEALGEVIAEAGNSNAFLLLLEKYKPDLVLMEIELPINYCVEAIRKVKVINPDIKIVVHNMNMKRINLKELVIAGVLGFLSKESDKNELKEAIKTISRGEYYFSDEFMHQIVLNQN